MALAAAGGLDDRAMNKALRPVIKLKRAMAPKELGHLHHIGPQIGGRPEDIQSIMADVTPEQREFLTSGITPGERAKASSPSSSSSELGL